MGVIAVPIVRVIVLASAVAIATAGVGVTGISYRVFGLGATALVVAYILIFWGSL